MSIMTARGHIQNGVVVLEQGVKLPEGQTVTVQSCEPGDRSASSRPVPRHSLLDIVPVSLGEVLYDPASDDDLLDEMLADRS